MTLTLLTMLRFLGCICSENALNVINPKLDDIGPKVENLIAMVANLDVSQSKPLESQLPDTFQNPEISGHTEELARSIKAVVTAASSVAGLNSSKWGGSESNVLYSSEYGELLDETWKTRMEQWIPPPMLEEEPAISMVVNASTEMSGAATPMEDELLQDDDLDDEVDFETVQRLIESGSESFAQQRYAEAVECYRAGIDRAKRLSQAKMSSLELEDVASKMASSEANIEFGLVCRVFEEAQQAFAKGYYREAADMFRNGISRTRKLSLDRRSDLDLRGIQQKSAISFLHQGDLDEAERAFKDMVGQQIVDDESRAYKLHGSSGLALVHLCRRNFLASERWCRQSLVGWRRLLGKEHSLYYRSLQLLAFIHETRGDVATASAFEILSKDWQNHSNEETDGCIENLVTIGLDTASSRALVTNYYEKCANDLLRDLNMDISAEEFEKDKALLTLVALRSGSDLKSSSNITFTIRLLLDQGADANAQDSEGGSTALMRASDNGHRDIVQLLCERGADVNAKDKEGETALHLAAQTGHKAVVELLLKQGANIEATERTGGNTALLKAAWYGRDSIAIILLHAGAVVSRKNRKGATALSIAASYGNEGVAKILLDTGADLETQDDIGHTPLSGAASWGKVEMVKMLLAAGAKVESRTMTGRTPLIVAAELGYRASMEILLDAGSNIDAQDYNGNTAFTLVLHANHREDCRCNFCSKLAVRSNIVRVLVLRGANLSLKNTLGDSAIDDTKNYQRIDKADIISILREAGHLEAGQFQGLDCEPQPDAKTAEAGLRQGVSSTSSLEPSRRSPGLADSANLEFGCLGV